MQIAERRHGVDIPDGNGIFVHVFAVPFIIEVIKLHFPVRDVAGMFRFGLGFFKSMPHRDERPEVCF